MTKKRKNSTANVPSAEHNVADPSAKKPKLKKDAYKKTNVEEINQLKTTERLYHSNFFHLQTEELLKASKLPDKHVKFIDTFYEQLVEFLTKLPTQDHEQAVHQLAWLKKQKICPPISKETQFDLSPIKFRFIAPTTILKIGAWSTQTVVNCEPVVDVCVEMPAEFFHDGNHLNGIYHRKKAVYLSYLAAKLSKWDAIVECKFTFVKGNPFQAALLLQANGKYGKHIRFQLHAGCNEENFKIERFAPEKSNVKQVYNGSIVKNAEHSATPYYNSTVLSNLNTKFSCEYLCNVLETNAHVNDAIILLKIWLRQRDLSHSHVGFSGYILSMFVAYLVQKGLVTKTMNSYQIIRQVWIQLANTAWNELGKSISMYESKFRTTQPEAEIFHQFFDVVFIDPTGYYNICADLSLDIYRRVRSESTVALQLLNNEHVNGFRYLFGTKMPLFTQVDHLARVNVAKITQNVNKSNAYFDYCGYWLKYVEKAVFPILRKGLDKRVHGIVPIFDGGNSAWAINADCTAAVPKLKFGLILNAEFALDILDKGPQSNLPEGEEFRQFWGDRSELRRFQDGSIAEACVWGALTSSLVEKRLVSQQIVQHLLSHHFSIAADEISYTAAEMDAAFSVDRAYRDFLDGDNNSENLAIQVIKSFDDLAKNLRSLDQLPLVITSVLGQSPVFRYCELTPILANARLFSQDDKETFNANIINHGVIQFETSGKWPNDLNAIERVKAAFYVQIAQGLRKKFRLRTRANVDSVDVIKDGYMFRLAIAVPREIALLKKEVTSKGITKYKDTPESVRIERDLVLMPKITVALHTLYHQHQSFGPTVMLAKRWLYSQMIDSHLFSDICTELLVAHQFYNCSGYASPTQPQTAFIRFLYTLANTNWAAEMILLNFNDDMSRSYIEKLELSFVSDRSLFPPLCVITSTGETDKHTVWSKKNPSVEILARVTLLARHAIKRIQQTISKELATETMFKASLDGYDLIINLSKMHIIHPLVFDFARAHFKTTIQRKPFIPKAGLNPVQIYLHELRSAYGHVAVFFYDPCGGDKIAVLWRPCTFEKQDFRVGAVKGQNVSETRLAFDHGQLQDDFLILGNGLVTDIVDNRKLAIKA